MVKAIKVLNRYGNKGDVFNYKVGDSGGIKQYALLKLSDAGYATSSAAANDPIAGISISEKEASDGQTTLGVLTNCRIEATMSNAAAIGVPITASATPHCFQTAPDAHTTSGAAVVGHTLEAASAGEVIEMRFTV